MSILGDRVARKTNVVGAKAHALDDKVESYLFDALGRTLDSIVIGVIIVADHGHILHANQAAQRMLDARSPIISLGGCLGALQGEVTKELRLAIATAQVDASVIGAVGIGVPLVDKNMIAATAHVLPLACGNRRTARTDTHTAAVASLPGSIDRGKCRYLKYRVENAITGSAIACEIPPITTIHTGDWMNRNNTPGITASSTRNTLRYRCLAG